MHIPANFMTLEAVQRLRGDAAPHGALAQGVIDLGSSVAAGEGQGSGGSAVCARRGCTAARRSELGCAAQRGDSQNGSAWKGP